MNRIILFEIVQREGNQEQHRLISMTEQVSPHLFISLDHVVVYRFNGNAQFFTDLQMAFALQLD